MVISSNHDVSIACRMNSKFVEGSESDVMAPSSSNEDAITPSCSTTMLATSTSKGALATATTTPTITTTTTTTAISYSASINGTASTNSMKSIKESSTSPTKLCSIKAKQTCSTSTKSKHASSKHTSLKKASTARKSTFKGETGFTDTYNADEVITKTAATKATDLSSCNDYAIATSLENADIKLVNAYVHPSEEEYKILVMELNTKLKESVGDEVVVEVGVSDTVVGLTTADLESSLKTLARIAEEIHADITPLREKNVSESGNRIKASKDGLVVSELLLRRRFEELDFHEVRVASVGNVDAGKSTLLGVITHGMLDDGRGKLRSCMFNHKHEVDSGRTSSVGYNILGFDSKGTVINRSVHGKLNWAEITSKSSKIINFLDLAGHERYLKTTLFGLTGRLPDFCMLMVGANAGLVGMCKEHLGITLALQVPVFVCITKVDMAPPNVLADTVEMVNKILKSSSVRKLPVQVKSRNDAIMAAKNISSTRIAPVFQISNVTGYNVDNLKIFLNLLSPTATFHAEKPVRYQIDDVFTVLGVGTVASGVLLQGIVVSGSILQLGPDSLGQYQNVTIKSIHRNRMLVPQLLAGQTGSLALKRVKRVAVRKGMVLLGKEEPLRASWEFEAEIRVLHHPTTISPRYQAMVHCGAIHQTATIVHMSQDHLRSGDRSIIRLRFIRHPEYILDGIRLIFREGTTKAVGRVIRAFLIDDVYPGLMAGKDGILMIPKERGGVNVKTGVDDDTDIAK